MANYPDVTQIIGTEVLPDAGTVVERAASGKPRIRSLYGRVEYMINVVHELDGPEKDSIWNHYVAHKGVDFNFKFRGGSGTTYTCMYVAAPKPIPVAGTDRWRVEVELVVV